jgi:molybdopterin-guanine dinucleotide biosynthesis protein
VAHSPQRARFGEVVNWAAVFGLALAVIPIVFQIFQLVNKNQWVGAGISLVFFAFLAYLTWRMVPRSVDEAPPSTSVFQPFVSAEKLSPWPREALVKAITGAINSGPVNVPTVVVGPSGAGKTVLLKRMVREAVEAGGGHYLYFDTYQGVDATLEDALRVARARAAQRQPVAAGAPNAAQPAQVVVVLDQFEQFLALYGDAAEAERERLKQWVIDLCSATQTDVRVVIGIRREWFYETRILGAVAPAPTSCVHVDPPRSDAAAETTNTIVGRFEQLTG